MNEIPKGTKCCSDVYRSDGLWHQIGRCQNSAKVIRDGNPYCGVHDPQKLAEKKAARDAKWRHERAVVQAEQAIKEAKTALVAAALLSTDPALEPTINAVRDAEARLTELKEQRGLEVAINA